MNAPPKLNVKSELATGLLRSIGALPATVGSGIIGAGVYSSMHNKKKKKYKRQLGEKLNTKKFALNPSATIKKLRSIPYKESVKDIARRESITSLSRLPANALSGAAIGIGGALGYSGAAKASEMLGIKKMDTQEKELVKETKQAEKVINKLQKVNKKYKRQFEDPIESNKFISSVLKDKLITGALYAGAGGMGALATQSLVGGISGRGRSHFRSLKKARHAEMIQEAKRENAVDKGVSRDNLPKSITREKQNKIYETEMSKEGKKPYKSVLGNLRVSTLGFEDPVSDTVKLNPKNNSIGNSNKQKINRLRQIESIDKHARSKFKVPEFENEDSENRSSNYDKYVQYKNKLLESKNIGSPIVSEQQKRMTKKFRLGNKEPKKLSDIRQFISPTSVVNGVAAVTGAGLVVGGIANAKTHHEKKRLRQLGSNYNKLNKPGINQTKLSDTIQTILEFQQYESQYLPEQKKSGLLKGALLGAGVVGAGLLLHKKFGIKKPLLNKKGSVIGSKTHAYTPEHIASATKEHAAKDFGVKAASAEEHAAANVSREQTANRSKLSFLPDKSMPNIPSPASLKPKPHKSLVKASDILSIWANILLQGDQEDTIKLGNQILKLAQTQEQYSQQYQPVERKGMGLLGKAALLGVGAIGAKMLHTKFSPKAIESTGSRRIGVFASNPGALKKNVKQAVNYGKAVEKNQKAITEKHNKVIAQQIKNKNLQPKIQAKQNKQVYKQQQHMNMMRDKYISVFKLMDEERKKQLKKIAVGTLVGAGTIGAGLLLKKKLNLGKVKQLAPKTKNKFDLSKIGKKYISGITKNKKLLPRTINRLKRKERSYKRIKNDTDAWVQSQRSKIDIVDVSKYPSNRKKIKINKKVPVISNYPTGYAPRHGIEEWEQIFKNKPEHKEFLDKKRLSENRYTSVFKLANPIESAGRIHEIQRNQPGSTVKNPKNKKYEVTGTGALTGAFLGSGSGILSKGSKLLAKQTNIPGRLAAVVADIGLGAGLGHGIESAYKAYKRHKEPKELSEIRYVSIFK